MSQSQVGAVRVAFLAPLTGRAASVGQALLNAAQIAAIERGSDNFILQPYDTGGTAQGAASAAQTAIAQGASMIIGPLFADSVRAVAPLAQSRNVPVVAFSTVSSVADSGVYLIGFLVEEQLRRVLSQARSQGNSRVAALLPASAEGEATAQALRTVAPQVGVQVVGVAFYDPSGANVSGPVSQVIGSGLDTLLLSDRGLGLEAVAAQLPYSGLNPGQVLVLGTLLWNSETGLGREPILVGARYPAPDERSSASFKEQYRNTYGTNPIDIAGLGYDATSLAAALARSGQPFSRSIFESSNGFAGVDGIFRFRPDGTVERGLAIKEITRDGALEVVPAPTSFSGS
jgi:ABC-type branched-subunit amino acid transport system substrate-binding protein